MTGEMRKTLLALITLWMERAMKGERVSWRRLGALIGCPNFLRAQIPRASLYLRAMHTALAAGVRSKGWNGWGTLPRRIISELQFWWRSVHHNTPWSFEQRTPVCTLTTDASERGWGAVFTIGDLHYTAYGSFSTLYSSASSNRRETTAVLKALLYFRPLLVQQNVNALALRSDNMVTVFNLQRQGASESLVYETRQIFSFLTKHDIRLSVTHVPGIENVTADALSRMDLVGDYSLRTDFYNRGISALGVNPTLDVFANVLNKKCEDWIKKYLKISFKDIFFR
jgi:ribonuclease HI